MNFFAKPILTVAFIVNSPLVLAMQASEPLTTKITVDKLEKRSSISGSNGQPFVWEAQAWVGYDLHKMVIKTKGERTSGEIHKAEAQALFSQAISPYWDLNMGVRHDFNPTPSQNWAAIGIQGTLPYFIESDLSFFINNDGQTNLRIATEYEAMITQRLVLSPSVELNLYGKNDGERDVGSGLGDMEIGLYLAYEIRREFAPYIGVTWERSFGKTAAYAHSDGEDNDDLQLVAGLRFWF